MRGHSTTFLPTGETISINNKARCLLPLRVQGKLYTLNCRVSTAEPSQSAHSSTQSESKTDINLWHERLAHLNKQMIQKLQASVEGLHIHGSSAHDSAKCEICILSKMKKKPFSSATTRASKPLELVHSDVAGPMRTSSAIDGHFYVQSTS